ncbi:slit homolog 2 protein-like [Mytilus trossulus]|uniref:slit homolog 2 protein-like n=1 Tax=Mytilus trossulus TaxID=6551 RepID=UPI003004D6DD
MVLSTVTFLGTLTKTKARRNNFTGFICALTKSPGLHISVQVLLISSQEYRKESWKMLYVVTVIVIVSLLEQTNAAPCSGTQISVCNCEDTRVFCNGRNLTTIPSDIPITTTRLDLDDNHISTLAEDAFADLVSLESITLFNNALGSLPAELFSFNTNLEFISLRRNNLSSLPPELFSMNTKLQNM